MYNFFLKNTNLNLKYKSGCFFKSSLIFFFLFVTSNALFSQTSLIEDVDYNKDSRSIVLILNSNGYAAGYRFSKRIDGYRSRLIDIDFNWVKHPKEQRIPSRYGNQNKFVYGKLNQLMIGRLGYGQQKEIYSKYTQEGIAISYYFLAGLDLGLLKPVYFDVVKLDAKGNTYISTEKFDADVIYNSGQIYGGSPFSKGFSETSAVLGGFIKFAFSFDINKKHRGINTLEIGSTLDIFHKKLPLMAFSEPQMYLISLFIAYRFGKKKIQRINATQ